MGLVLPESPAASEHCEVFEENWASLEMFLKVQTQWRVGMNGLIGLDYSAVAWVLRLFSEGSDHRSLLEDLQIMENAVLSFVAKQER
jgi:hypothetical protein